MIYLKEKYILLNTTELTWPTFYTSQFTKSVTISVDGFGDFAVLLLNLGTTQELIFQRKFFPHSLGVFILLLHNF